MVSRPEVLVIVPARGGSKGIPRKNIRDFCGHPLVAYSIHAGVSAKSVTRVILSTDDPEIAAVGRSYGAETPFLRPQELAQDTSVDFPLFVHALDWLWESERYQPQVVVQLRPTSPLRPPSLIDDAVGLLLGNDKADSVRGVVPAGQNPHKMWRIDPLTKVMHPLLAVDGIAEPYNAPRQILPPVFWQTGHIDAIRTATIREKQSLSGDVILPLLIDARYMVDIDSLNDWRRAEWLVSFGDLDIVYPGCKRRQMPKHLRLVVFDFDGVMTDNRVWVDENGHEQIAAYRSDSVGLGLMRKAGIDSLVLSMETNPVVSARCKKIGIPAIQGVATKAEVLNAYLKEKAIDPQCVIYVGNDTIDIPCFKEVGYAVAVADAHAEVLRSADFVLSQPGGHGAVRELCDLILSHLRSG